MPPYAKPIVGSEAALPRMPFPGLLRDGPPKARLRKRDLPFLCHRQREGSVSPDRSVDYRADPRRHLGMPPYVFLPALFAPDISVALFCRELLIHLHQRGHAVGFREAFDREAVGRHNGAVVGLVGLAQLRGHKCIVIQIRQS